MNRITTMRTAAAIATACGVAGAHADCVTTLAGEVRYSYAQSHSVSMSLEVQQSDWERGRIDQVRTCWRGGLSAKAKRGGRDYPGECDPNPPVNCSCDYVSQYSDGDDVAAQWNQCREYRLRGINDFISVLGSDFGGSSSAQGASATATARVGQHSASRYGAGFGRNEHAVHLSNSSGSLMSQNTGYTQFLCFTSCDQPYSDYVGNAAGSTETKEEHAVYLEANNAHPQVTLFLNLTAGASYNTSFTDHVVYGDFCGQDGSTPYGTVKITCLDTPGPLSLRTESAFEIRVVKREGSRIFPSSVIERWNFSGSFISTPTSFSADGAFMPMLENASESHSVSNSEDYGLPPGTRMSESWSGSGAMDVSFPLSFEYKGECAVIVTRTVSTSQ